MYKSTIYRVSPSSSREQLRRILEDREYSAGPIIALSPYKSEATWITCSDQSPPKKSILLEDYPPRSPLPEKQGYELVCIGDCFIESAPKSIAVFRQKD